MNHSLDTFSSGVKLALHLVHFMINFELQLQETTKWFSYFWLQPIRMKSNKKLCPRFLITFLLFQLLTYITFLFPLKLELKIKILHNIRIAHFLRNQAYGFAQQLFPQTYTVFSLWISKRLLSSSWKDKDFWRQDWEYNGLCIISSANKTY